MHDPQAMRGVQRVGDLARDRGSSRGRQGAIGRNDLLERAAGHELHGQIHCTVAGLAEVEHASDAFVLDAAGVGGLAIESGHRAGVAHHLRPQHLDRRALGQSHMLGEIDRAHAAGAQQIGHEVAVGDHRADQITRRFRRVQRGAVGRAENIGVSVRRAADRADLGHGAVLWDVPQAGRRGRTNKKVYCILTIQPERGDVPTDRSLVPARDATPERAV